MKISLPLRGLNKGLPVNDSLSEFSPHLNNVRPQDVLAGRLRVGQRPGLAKWSTDQVGDDEQPVVAICSVNYTESPS